jgi:hypothetical protein
MVLRIPLRGTRLRRAVDPGDLCQPSGPDGEGKARPGRRGANLCAAAKRSNQADDGRFQTNENACLPAQTIAIDRHG